MERFPLPTEILLDIAKNLSYQDILDYCSTNKQLRNVCQQPLFWRELVRHRIGYVPDSTINWQSMYQIILEDPKFSPVEFQRLLIIRAILDAIKKNNNNLAISLIDEYPIGLEIIGSEAIAQHNTVISQYLNNNYGITHPQYVVGSIDPLNNRLIIKSNFQDPRIRVQGRSCISHMKPDLYLILQYLTIKIDQKVLTATRIQLCELIRLGFKIIGQLHPYQPPILSRSVTPRSEQKGRKSRR